MKVCKVYDIHFMTCSCVQAKKRVWILGKLLTISDYSYVNVCSHSVSTKVSGCHKYAASSHKRVINKITLLDLQTSSCYHKTLWQDASCFDHALMYTMHGIPERKILTLHEVYHTH